MIWQWLKRQLKVQDIQQRIKKKANIIYFSATGNTLKTVLSAEEFLKNKGYEVVVEVFDSNFIPDFTGTELFIVMFPVVYSTTYRFIFNCLKNFPQVDSIRTIIACTYGGHAPGLINRVAELLVPKGFSVYDTILLKTPSLYKKENINEDDLHLLEVNSLNFNNNISKVIERENVKTVNNFADLSDTSEPEDLWVKLHSLIHIDFNWDLCVKCGKCAELCPVNCITIMSNSYDKIQCDLCFRCFYYCPVEAISVKGLDIFRNSLFTGNKINYRNGYTNDIKEKTKQGKEEIQKISI